jgi:hypothetical protein
MESKPWPANQDAPSNTVNGGLAIVNRLSLKLASELFLYHVLERETRRSLKASEM